MKYNLTLGTLAVLSVLSALYLCMWRQDTSNMVTVLPPCGFRCSEDTSQYLINTPGCMIPGFQESEILYGRHPPIKNFLCATKPRLTEQKGQDLLLHMDRASHYNLTPATINCFYQPIDTSMKRGSKLMESLELKKEITPVVADGVVVTCHENTTGKNTIIYKELHNFIQPARVEKKRQSFKMRYGSRREHPEKLSVLVMGTDAVSRFNAIRNMPKTFNYLTQKLGALDFKGFNKIGENTLPNVYAILTGYTHNELDEVGCVREGRTLDDCPLIWKEFAKAGYVTGFGEDVLGTGADIFNYRHRGFQEQPVDYFLRRTFGRAQNSHGVSNFGGGNYAPCQGSKTNMRIIHDYALAMAEELTDIPYFSFYWSAALTHDALRMARVADEELLRLITQFHDKGYLNHTVLFIISDHGLRYGPLRHTYIGLVEEKLPFVFVLFPQWFKTTYPESWDNLVKNTKKLVSNVDLHQTLHSLARGDFNSSNKRSKDVFDVSGGMSLFQEIPDSRICADMRIPERHCACEVYETVSIKNPNVTAAVKVAMDEVNLIIKLYPKCVPLRVDKVMSARLAYPTTIMTPRNPVHQVSTYLIEFQTKPSGAMLEAMVRKKHKEYSVVGQVLRTNLYGKQSHCIKDPGAKLFCYCKDLLQLPKT